MSDNLTTGTSLSSIASASVVATHDLANEGGTGHAQKVATLPLRYTPTGHDFAITVSTSVIKSGSGLTVPSNTSHALLSVESGDVRFTEDGTDPTAANGVLLIAGQVVELPIPVTAANLRFIKSNTAAADATVNVNYRKYV